MIEIIDYWKDVDGFYFINVGCMFIGFFCYVFVIFNGILELLKCYYIEI